MSKLNGKPPLLARRKPRAPGKAFAVPGQHLTADQPQTEATTLPTERTGPPIKRGVRLRRKATPFM